MNYLSFFEKPQNMIGSNVVVVIGPVPPPFHGVTVAINRVLCSKDKGNFEFIHLDTSDRRDFSNVGRNDLNNYFLAIVSYIRLVKMCIKYSPKIIYIPISQTFIGYARDSIYFLIGMIFSRARVVIHLHGGYFDTFYKKCHKIARWYIDLTMKIPDRAIVLSEVFVSIFSRWFAPSSIDIVPNGTDPDNEIIEYKKAKFRCLNAGARKITYLSSLIGSKGICDFVAAATECLKLYPDLVFLIAGEWWGEDLLVKQNINCLLNDTNRGRIRFLGLVSGNAKQELFKETDILVLPTYYPFEGQPTVIIEAMSYGIPVVATKHASIPDMVVEGRTGFLVPIKDVPALTRGICRLVEDPVLWKAVSIASYERFTACYTEAQSNQKLVNSFSRAMSS